jgi:hypothetical protein
MVTLFGNYMTVWLVCDHQIGWASIGQSFIEARFFDSILYVLLL